MSVIIKHYAQICVHGCFSNSRSDVLDNYFFCLLSVLHQIIGNLLKTGV